MPASRLGRFVLLPTFVLSAISAHACTVCDSPTGHQVRAGLFNGHFLHMLLITALPFPLFALAVLLVHFGMPDLAVPVSQPENLWPPSPFAPPEAESAIL